MFYYVERNKIKYYCSFYKKIIWFKLSQKIAPISVSKLIKEVFHARLESKYHSKKEDDIS